MVGAKCRTCRIVLSVMRSALLSCIAPCAVDDDDDGGAIEEEGVLDVTSTIGSFCEVDGDVLVMVTICLTVAQAAVLLVFITSWIDDKD